MKDNDQKILEEAYSKIMKENHDEAGNIQQPEEPFIVPRGGFGSWKLSTAKKELSRHVKQLAEHIDQLIEDESWFAIYNKAGIIDGFAHGLWEEDKNRKEKNAR